MQLTPRHFPEGFPHGPWGVTDDSAFWYVVSTTGQAKKVGRVSGRRKGPNYFDRAMEEAARRNRLLVPEIPPTAKHEDPPAYGPAELPESDNEVIVRALEILERHVGRGRPVMDAPQKVREYLCLQYAREEREIFGILFVDGQHHVIGFEPMFYGTLTQTSVYPREVAKRALQLNAGAVILSHNHPSGTPEPSRADEYLTQALKAALALVDVRVLDHIVVGGGQSVSFAERGLL